MHVKTTLSYLAGAMDSDGSFSIRRRKRKGNQFPLYFERVSLKQVTPQIPTLLRDTFGGTIWQQKPSAKDGRPLWTWECVGPQAADACRALLPFLRVKPGRAALLMELRRTFDEQFQRHSYWYAKEHPRWRREPLLTSAEVGALLGYKTPHFANYACYRGTLLGLPATKSIRGKPQSRFAAGLVHILKDRPRRGSSVPRQVFEWRQQLWEELRELNKCGVNGTPTYHRSGCYAPKF